MKLMLIAGARPNFMKIAPITRELARHPDIDAMLVHTGQHYDEKMSDLFFRQLGLPKPDINLEVGSGSHATQTAALMTRFEPVLLEHKPDAVLVVGDVNSTIACGLVAVKLGVPLIHVEAGLRSGDRSMPEEINRILTDAISDLLFCTEQAGVDNLSREGVAPAKVHLVGNVMIDTLLQNQARFAESTILEDLGLKPERFAVLTLHRPSNVDDPEIFAGLLGRARGGAGGTAGNFSGAPADPCSPRGVRVRWPARGDAAAAPDRPGRVPRFPAPVVDRPRRADRLGRDPGGDDCAGGALPDPQGEHRATRHHHARVEPPGGDAARGHHRGLSGRDGGSRPRAARAAALGRQGRGADRCRDLRLGQTQISD
jgi:hypothetical protein